MNTENILDEIFMKIAELRNRNVDQLNEDLVSLKKEAFNLRFQKATGQLENTARVRYVRRSIARVSTVLSQKATEVAE